MTTLRSPFSRGFTPSAAEDLAFTLKVLADPTRLKILAMLHANDPMSVTELTAKLPLSQPTVSHHLRILDEAGLVIARRDHQFVLRRVSKGRMRAIAHLLDPGGEL